MDAVEQGKAGEDGKREKRGKERMAGKNWGKDSGDVDNGSLDCSKAMSKNTSQQASRGVHAPQANT